MSINDKKRELLSLAIIRIKNYLYAVLQKLTKKLGK